jgi:4-carboxymuconolactone decarboxylase
MAKAPTTESRDRVRGTVPKLIDLSEKVLFGDVWERPGLSKRDRSLIVVATLIALGREKQLVGHLERALNNGLSKTELSEVITHLAFYAGWPAAMTAALVAKDVFEKK